MKDYPNIYKPIKIGPLLMKNRLEAAPVSVSDLTPEGYLTDAHAALYGRKAEGGAGQVTIGEGYVSRKTGRAHALVIPLFDELVLPGYINTTDAIKQHGAIASGELLHCGVRSVPEMCENGLVFGPSEGTNSYGGSITPMTEKDILETVEEFGDAAEMARLGGADMIMVHGGHGWLLSNFISPIHNQRKDEFGGSMENRARISLMVIENIRKKCGSDFPIEFRMSGSEFIDEGYGLEEGVEFAKLLDGKVDIIHVSATSFHDMNAGLRMFPGMFLPHGCNVFLAEAIKKEVNTPVATLGGINYPDHIESILAAGQADIVSLGRALSADPFLPEKIRSGNSEDIRPCLRCNDCISSIFVPYIKYATRVSRCAVNPEHGRELEYHGVKAAEVSKKVLIAGGGPGGMQAAITAADRGHEVFLYEKNNTLGGVLDYGARPDFKDDLKKFNEYLINSVKKREVKVELGKEVDIDTVRKIDPDVLITTVGADPIIPDIPGIKSSNVCMLDEILKGEAETGDRVVIVGGGLAGCEEGLHLAKQGKNVTIVEMGDKLASDATYLHWRSLMLELEDTVKTVTNTTCIGIKDMGITTSDGQGSEGTIEADTIIIAVGYQPKHGYVEEMLDGPWKSMVIGDCNRPARVKEAVHGGHFAALDI